MARDGQSIAIKVIWTTTGPKTGTSSNTVYAKWTGGLAASFADWQFAANDVWAFFNGTSGGAGTLTYYMGPQVWTGANGTVINVYNLDLADAEHHFGSPVYSVNKTKGASGTSNPLPNEVAAVLSYRASYGTDPEHAGSTRPRASDRGRHYIGPLQTGAIAGSTAPNGTQVAVLDTGMMNTMKNGFSTLFTALAGHQWQMSVWSRKEQVLKPVGFKAVDNSFDSSRRREVEPPGIQSWILI